MGLNIVEENVDKNENGIFIMIIVHWQSGKTSEFGHDVMDLKSPSCLLVCVVSVGVTVRLTVTNDGVEDVTGILS